MKTLAATPHLQKQRKKNSLHHLSIHIPIIKKRSRRKEGAGEQAQKKNLCRRETSFIIQHQTESIVMACSAVALSVATVASVVALTCTAIAFGTDNWYEVRVNPDGNERLASLQEFESDLRYYSRDEGIFRICFPDKRPKGVQTYMSPVQTQCLNIDYYINDNGISDSFTDQRWMRLHMARSVVALFIVSFLFSTLSAFPGLVGCWRRSHSNIIATGLLQLLAGLVVASAIGLWHAIPHYEYEKLNFPEMSFSRWPEVLQIYSRSYYGWSYVLAWLGVALTLSSSFMFLCGAQCLRKEKQKEKTQGTAYLVPIYAGPYHCPYSY